MGNSQSEHKLSILDYMKTCIKTNKIQMEIVNTECEEYVIVITKGIWYSCKLFVRYNFELGYNHGLANLNTNNKWENLPGVVLETVIPDTNSKLQVFHYNRELENTNHMTKKGASRHIKEYKTEISKGKYNINSAYSPYHDFTKYQNLPILTEQIAQFYKEYFLSVNAIPPKYEISKNKGQMDKLKNMGLFAGSITEIIGRVQELHFQIEEIEFMMEFMEIFHIKSKEYEDEIRYSYNLGTGETETTYEGHYEYYTYNEHHIIISLYIISKVIKKKTEIFLKSKKYREIVSLPWIADIMNRNLSDFISFDLYYKHFCIKHQTINNPKLREEFGIEQAIKTIPAGSILRIYRNKTLYKYWHAGVYLGADLIVDVNINEFKKGEIFKFSILDQFIGKSTKLEIIVLLYQPFSVNEIKEEAVRMNGKEWAYHLSENNCEHLAFLCAVGISGSPQMLNSWKKCIAQVGNGSAEKSS